MIMGDILYKTFFATCWGLLFMTCAAGQSLGRLSQDKELEESNIGLPVYHIPDFSFVDLSTGAALDVNAEGLFLSPDSSLLSAIVYMYLTTEDSLATVYGCSYGKVLDGRKEGLWTKEQFRGKGEMVVVRRLNYREGVLDGDVRYYNLKGENLPYRIRNLDGSVLEKFFYSFQKGIGTFVDCHYDTEVLSVRFMLKEGRLEEGYVEVFDKNGFRVLADRYFNGYRINY